MRTNILHFANKTIILFRDQVFDQYVDTIIDSYIQGVG